MTGAHRVPPLTLVEGVVTMGVAALEALGRLQLWQLQLTLNSGSGFWLTCSNLQPARWQMRLILEVCFVFRAGMYCNASRYQARQKQVARSHLD